MVINNDNMPVYRQRIQASLRILNDNCVCVNCGDFDVNVLIRLDENIKVEMNAIFVRDNCGHGEGFDLGF